MVELSKLNDVLKDLRNEGYVPTKRAIELVKLMGKDMSANALMQGAITLKRNDDKTFDIMIGKEIIESSNHFEKMLEHFFHSLTDKNKIHEERKRIINLATLLENIKFSSSKKQ